MFALELQVILQLQQQTLAQVARRYADGIHALHQRNGLFQSVLGDDRLHGRLAHWLDLQVMYWSLWCIRCRKIVIPRDHTQRLVLVFDVFFYRFRVRHSQCRELFGDGALLRANIGIGI